MGSWPVPPEMAIAIAVALVVVAIVLVVVRRGRRRPAEVEAETEPTVEPEELEPAPPPKGLRGALAKSREALRQRLAAVFGGGRELDGWLELLEEALVSADVGVKTTT